MSYGSIQRPTCTSDKVESEKLQAGTTELIGPEFVMPDPLELAKDSFALEGVRDGSLTVFGASFHKEISRILRDIDR